MKLNIKQMVQDALQRACDNGDLAPGDFPEPNVTEETDENKVAAHGEFSANMAMVLASAQKMAPRKIAEILLSHLKDADGLVERTEIAGPGFINFYIRPEAWHPMLMRIREADADYGASDMGKGKKAQVEFVSSNPTGPLHFGHGRGAAVGDSLANILSLCGYDVEKEYYINDSGRQIDTLGRSVFCRYKTLLGEDVDFPPEYYQGDYIRDLAAEIKAEKGDALLSGDAGEATSFCGRFAVERIMAGIRRDLADFGVTFDVWFSEQSLYDSGRVDQVLDKYEKQGVIYKKDGASWFKTSDYGDEKDRVVKRSNGQTTYFASDIAYHQDKYERGFDQVIDVWGADHHGYVARMTAAVEALGHDRNQFRVILVHLVNLLRGGEPAAMSTRAGEFITLKDVVDEVGADAARFIFLTRHYESPLDFDLELAKQKTNDNPVYYVQYVHARISSILEKGRERGVEPVTLEEETLRNLAAPEEIVLIKILVRYPEIVQSAAECMEPHRITYYLMNLASAFHAYYNKHRVLAEEADLAQARLYLVLAVKTVIRNGLALLGVSAPEKM